MCDPDPIQRLETLGRAGFTVSVCAGPSGAHRFRWSVLVGFPTGDAFARPYAADSFAHAVWIAEHEIEKRGWRVPRAK